MNFGFRLLVQHARLPIRRDGSGVRSAVNGGDAIAAWKVLPNGRISRVGIICRPSQSIILLKLMAAGASRYMWRKANLFLQPLPAPLLLLAIS
ncbi:MAG: hypothetical protein ACREQN_09895 [Candidatus Binataceae bacterium]